MKKQFKWIWPVLWLVICLFGGGGTLFSWMPRTPAMFYGGLAMLTVACACRKACWQWQWASRRVGCVGLSAA